VKGLHAKCVIVYDRLVAHLGDPYRPVANNPSSPIMTLLPVAGSSQTKILLKKHYTKTHTIKKTHTHILHTYYTHTTHAHTHTHILHTHYTCTHTQTQTHTHYSYTYTH